jgi:hypothetical protein
LLEGLFTVLFAVVVYLVLPDYPKSARSNSWLTAREQEYLEARLSENAPQTADATFTTSEVFASLRDPRTYAFMLSQVLVNFGGYGLQWQLPTITTSLGFAGLPRNQLLNIPPAGATVLSIIFAGWFLKRAIITRPAFIMIIMVGMLVSFVLLATLTSRGGIYAACVLGTVFYSVYFIPFWACEFPHLLSEKRQLIYQRAIINSQRNNRYSIHPRFPVLRWSSWWRDRTSTLSISLRL